MNTDTQGNLAILREFSVTCCSVLDVEELLEQEASPIWILGYPSTTTVNFKLTEGSSVLAGEQASQRPFVTQSRIVSFRRRVKHSFSRLRLLLSIVSMVTNHLYTLHRNP